MKVRYTGHKARVPVHLPIGAKTKGTIRRVLFADPVVELSEADAKALISLSPSQFELVQDEGVEIHEDGPRRPGRPKKVMRAG